MKRRVAALVLAVHFRATGQKFLDRLHVAHLCGSENILGSQKFLGCLAALGAEQFDNLSALFRDGVIERCLVFLVLGIDRCALLQQQRRRGLVAFLGSVVQCRLLRLVGGSDIGLGLQQRADSIDLPRLGCDVQCRLAGLVLAVHIDTGLEVLFDGINRADLRGDKNRLRRLLVALARHADAAEVVGQFPLGLTGGEVERGAPLFVLGREVGLGLDQQLGSSLAMAS